MSTVVAKPRPQVTEQPGFPDPRITEEAERLDRLFPGWHTRIDLAELHLPSLTRCILGQGTEMGFGPARDVMDKDAARSGQEVFRAAYAASWFTDDWICEIERRRARL